MKIKSVVLLVFCIAIISHGRGELGVGLFSRKASPINWPKPIESKLVKGSETNGVKAVLIVNYYLSSQLETATKENINTAISITTSILFDGNANYANLSSNLLMLDFPQPESCCLFNLKSADGKDVTKTPKGEYLKNAFLTPPDLQKTTNDLIIIDTGFRPSRHILSLDNSYAFPTLLLQDYFMIKTSGVYYLSCTVKAFKPANNHSNEVIYLPRIEAAINVNIKNSAN